MFKDKILAELRKKFPGLSAAMLGLIATKLAEKVTEETAIEGAITELDNLPIPITEFAKMLQTEGDRRVTEAEKKWKKTTPKPEDTKEDVDDIPDDTPSGKLFKKLQQEIADIRKEKNQATLTEQLHAKLKEKKIPLQMAKGVVLEKAEDLDAVLASIETEYTDFKQELVNQNLMVEAPKGGSNHTQKPEAMDADIKAWATAGKSAEEPKK